MTVVKWLVQRGVKAKHEEAEQETTRYHDLTPPFTPCQNIMVPLHVKAG